MIILSICCRFLCVIEREQDVKCKNKCPYCLHSICSHIAHRIFDAGCDGVEAPASFLFMFCFHAAFVDFQLH